MRWAIIAFLILSCEGCATTTTGPTPAGENTYIVSRQEGAFPTGREPLLAEAIEIANNFCANMGKVVKIINTHENLVVIAHFPKATVTFSCIDKTSGG